MDADAAVDVREDGECVPRFLLASDHPWLGGLIECHERFEGRRWAELEDHLRWTRGAAVDGKKRALALRTLAGFYRGSPRTVVAPRVARARLFGWAARAALVPRAEAMTAVASELGLDPATLEKILFADLRRERIVAPSPSPLSAGELAQRCNLALAQALVQRASHVEIELEGNARRVVRQAHLRGLMCVASRAADESGARARIALSGPFALFRHTRIYGHALAGLVPLLAWCRSFRLRASLVFADGSARLVLRTGDPLFPADPPKPFDSHLERRFARDFARAAPEWEIVREPEPISAGRHLVFPDFALVHRADPGRRWLLELAGFWTADYVRTKLERYRAVNCERLILCIDQARQCDESELPASAAVIRFRRTVDVAEVLRRIA